MKLDADALLDTLVWLGEIPTDRIIDEPRRVREGNLEHIIFELLFAAEEETIRLRVKAICSPTHGFLTAAWVNTNAPLGRDVLEQWLAKVSFPE